jgi:hypothetical protein
MFEATQPYYYRLEAFSRAFWGALRMLLWRLSGLCSRSEQRLRTVQPRVLLLSAVICGLAWLLTHTCAAIW